MAEPAATQTEQPRGALARLGELAWQALPAIAGAVGILGFVALVGGAIQWVRFFSAGLPADQAVRVMPEAELVTIGAVSLVAFAVLGVLAVLLLYSLDSNGNASIGTLRGLFALAGVETLVALLSADLPWEEYAGLVPALLIVGGIAYAALSGVPARLRERDARRRADDTLRAALLPFRAAQDRYDDVLFQMKGTPPNGPLMILLREASMELRRARREWNRALDAWIAAGPEEEREHRRAATERFRDVPANGEEQPVRPPAEAQLAAVIASKPELEPKPKPKPKPRPKAKRRRPAPRTAAEPGMLAEARRWFREARRWFRAFRVRLALAAIALLVAGMVVLAIAGPDGQDEEERLFAGGLFVVILLAAANFGLARATQRFAWYGVGALLSLILFGAAMNIGRTVIDPEVQPLALVRKSDQRALCGVYVTETDKRVYLGRVVGDEGKNEIGADLGSGRMFWVPSADVDVVSIGPRQEIEDAEVRARLLTNEVLADRAEKPAPAQGGAADTLQDALTACATPAITEERVDELKPAVRRSPARHPAP